MTSSNSVDEGLKEEAADLVNWLLDCIPPSAYDSGKLRLSRWDWALKGLRKATRYNPTFDEMIEKLRDPLPIKGALGKSTSEKVNALAEKLKSARQVKRFRDICRKNATMIIVRARKKRDRRDSAGLNPDADPEDFPTLHTEE